MTAKATKSEFARLVKLTPGRISQFIADGRLKDCLIVEGGKTLIDVEKALDRLKLRRHGGQALGNGAKTRLNLTPSQEADDIELKIKRARLEEVELRNRRLREEELVKQGVLMRADDVSAEMARTARIMVEKFESEIPSVAREMAARFGVPERDLVFMLRKQFTAVRATVADKLKTCAEALPELQEADLEQFVDKALRSPDGGRAPKPS